MRIPDYAKALIVFSPFIVGAIIALLIFISEKNKSRKQLKKNKAGNYYSPENIEKRNFEEAPLNGFNNSDYDFITKSITRRRIPKNLNIQDIVCIDFETANEKRNSPCAVGICYFDSNEQIRSRSWLIKPKEMQFNDINIQIHGLEPELFHDKPDFPEVWSEVLPFLENKTLAAHYATFDCSVLDNTIDLYGIVNPGFNFICTCRLSRVVFNNMQNYKLPTIAKKIGINLNHHFVESDVKAAMEIIKYVLNLNPGKKAYTLLKKAAIF